MFNENGFLLIFLLLVCADNASCKQVWQHTVNAMHIKWFTLCTTLALEDFFCVVGQCFILVHSEIFLVCAEWTTKRIPFSYCKARLINQILFLRWYLVTNPGFINLRLPIQLTVKFMVSQKWKLRNMLDQVCILQTLRKRKEMVGHHALSVDANRWLHQNQIVHIAMNITQLELSLHMAH